VIHYHGLPITPATAAAKVISGGLRRGIARSGPDESHLRKAFALLVYAEMRLNHNGAIRSDV
jgi:hypothetical protein